MISSKFLAAKPQNSQNLFGRIPQNSQNLRVFL
jgi:hypothetical protein